MTAARGGTGTGGGNATDPWNDNTGGKTKVEEPASRSILGFLDSLYAGVIAFGFGLGADATIRSYPAVPLLDVLWKLGPAIIAVAYVIDDWVNARPLLERYPHRPTVSTIRLRLWIDLTIMGLSFLWITSAIVLSAGWYLAIAAGICLLGWAWAKAVEREYLKPTDWELEAIVSSHLFTGVILAIIALIVWVVDRSVILSGQPQKSWETLKRILAMGLPGGMLIWYKISGWRCQREAAGEIGRRRDV